MSKLRNIAMAFVALHVIYLGAALPARAAPLAELVSMRTDDRVLLHGLHYRPEQQSHSVVIQVPGGPGAFYSMQDMSPLAEALNRNGYHFISMNLRTAGANGMLYAKFEDCLLDIAAAVKHAKDKGLTNIILLVPSLSAPRAFYYLAKSKEPAIKGLVLVGAIMSPYLEAQLRWSEGERAKYDEFLSRQRAAVKAGNGREIAAYPWAGGRSWEFSAATWISVFGNPEESNASAMKYAKEITIPVLLIHGTKDDGSLPENSRRLQASLENAPSKELVMIDGADHMFIGTAGKFAQVAGDWVIKTFPAVR